jgi:hypothetical protein
MEKRDIIEMEIDSSIQMLGNLKDLLVKMKEEKSYKANLPAETFD